MDEGSRPSAALARALDTLAVIPLGHYPTPVDALDRLRAALGGPRLLVKRDDAIDFAFGGNKVRKLAYVAARARDDGADTLITAGGIQSNHARVTAAAAARLGMDCVIVVNGADPLRPGGTGRLTANARLDALLGARVEYVAARADRAPRMAAIAGELTRAGRRPYVIPIGASIPLGAVGYVRAVAELAEQIPPPDAIIHSTSSAGTQAGIVAGCRILGWPTRVIGVSADDPAAWIAEHVDTLIEGIGELLGLRREVAAGTPVDIDDTFIGEGYGIPSDASNEAIEIVARTEALFLDPTYTAKAMAALIAYVRNGRFPRDGTVLFWHTGGQVGLFA